MIKGTIFQLKFDEGKKQFPDLVIVTARYLCYSLYFASRTPIFSDYSKDGSTSGNHLRRKRQTQRDWFAIRLQGEKWRASFTHYTGQLGDHELTNSLVIADYFFSGEFFVGAGIASMQLTNSSAGSSISASATSPVLQVGYTENLTKNLQLSIGCSSIARVFLSAILVRLHQGIVLARNTDCNR